MNTHPLCHTCVINLYLLTCTSPEIIKIVFRRFQGEQTSINLLNVASEIW